MTQLIKEKGIQGFRVFELCDKILLTKLTMLSNEVCLDVIALAQGLLKMKVYV